jgi:hypothetical protein
VLLNRSAIVAIAIIQVCSWTMFLLHVAALFQFGSHVLRWSLHATTLF